MNLQATMEFFEIEKGKQMQAVRAERIRRLRIRLNLHKYQVADICQLSLGQISFVEQVGRFGNKNTQANRIKVYLTLKQLFCVGGKIGDDLHSQIKY